MRTLMLWLTEPLSLQKSIKLWMVLTVFVFSIWFTIPMYVDPYPLEYLAIRLSPENAAVFFAASFGEEFTFRAIPILLAYFLFPKNTMFALAAGIGMAYFFGMWHEWILTQKTFLGIGGIVLTFIYLKFGGASGEPFKGFIACGSSHTVCNFGAAIIANIAT